MIFRPVERSDLERSDIERSDLERSDLERLKPLLVSDPASALIAGRFLVRFEAGEYRPAWTWIAEESPNADPAAVAIWWGTARENLPAALDGLFTADATGSGQRAAAGADAGAGAGADGGAGAGAGAGALAADPRVALATNLLTAAHQAFAEAGLDRPPDFHIFLPPDWRDRQDVTAALNWRLEAARRVGLTSILERVRYEWTPAAGVPAPSGRLRFRPEPDDEVFTDLFSRVLTGTLDARSRNEAAVSGSRTQASHDVAFYRDHLPGRRSWWRVAETPDGELAGFGLPSRNTDVPVVGYLGVVPEHRGHGFAGDILAEITRILVAEAGATAIHADTDLENRPMAVAFEQAGYRPVGRRLVLSAS